MNANEIIIPCRLSYANIWEPKQVNGTGDPKYSCCLLMAILQKGKGLVWGAAEGVLFAGLLFILGTLYQSEWETMQFVRAGLVLLMGVLGGVLGMLRAERKRR